MATQYLPTAVVGSYSMPAWLERAKNDYLRRRITAHDLDEMHDVLAPGVEPGAAEREVRPPADGQPEDLSEKGPRPGQLRRADIDVVQADDRQGAPPFLRSEVSRTKKPRSHLRGFEPCGEPAEA